MKTTLLICFAVVMPGCKGPPESAPASPAVEPPTSQPVAAADVRPGLVLPEAERKHLAEIEHRALLLSGYGFPRLAAPWSEGAASPLARAFAPKASGKLVTWGPASGAGGLSVRRGSDPRQVDLPALLTGLLELASRFDGPPVIKLMIRSLAPAQRTEYAGAWSGDARVRLAGKAVGGGLREILGEVELEFVRIPEATEFKAATGWVSEFRFTELVEVTTPAPLMEDTTAGSGLNTAALTDNWTLDNPADRQPVPGGIYLSDVDRDGWIDLLVTDRDKAIFHRGLPGGRFEDQTVQAGLGGTVRFLGTVAFADLDGDGLPDLILGDRVFRNASAGGAIRFVDVTKKTSLLDGPGSGITLLDYDLDGRIDVYLCRSFKGQKKEQSWLDGPGGPGNQLWRNVGDWRFEDVTKRTNAAAGARSVFTTAALDANNDGRPDLYVIGEFGPGLLLINEGGRFREHLLENDDGDFGSMGLTVGDVTGDGRVDIYTANMYSKAGRRVIDGLGEGFYEPAVFKRINRFITGSELYVQTGAQPGELKFERRGGAGGLKDVGWAYGPALADLDNDGDLDLYATAGFNSVSRRRPDG